MCNNTWVDIMHLGQLFCDLVETDKDCGLHNTIRGLQHNRRNPLLSVNPNIMQPTIARSSCILKNIFCYLLKTELYWQELSIHQYKESTMTDNTSFCSVYMSCFLCCALLQQVLWVHHASSTIIFCYHFKNRLEFYRQDLSTEQYEESTTTDNTRYQLLFSLLHVMLFVLCTPATSLVSLSCILDKCFCYLLKKRQE